MRVGIIGLGMVGKTIYEGLGSIGNKMHFYDPKYDQSTFIDILNTDCVFVCVPTNPLSGGKCDISIVDDVLSKLYYHHYQGVVIIKSTVTPGTTRMLSNKYRTIVSYEKSVDKLKICFVPEFLRERCSLSDFIDNHDVCIIGVDPGEFAYDIIDVVKTVHGNLPKQFKVMSTTEAELSKYFNNVYNAARITFANGFYEVCKALGANYQNILDAMICRDNITGHYLKCSDTLRGYGGLCLGKDTLSFCHLIESLHKDGMLEIYPEIFKHINNDNAKYARTILPGMRTEEECFGEKLEIIV